MGYATSPRLIEENVDLLRRIRERIEKGETYRLRVLNNAAISTEQYRLRRVLAATDNHPTVYGGEFARLGQRVSLRVDGTAGLIVVSPRKISTPNLEEYRASERDALDFLVEAKGSMTVLEFFPSESFALLAFVEAARTKGWQVFPETLSREEGGKISLAAERIEEGLSDDEDLSDFLRK